MRKFLYGRVRGPLARLSPLLALVIPFALAACGNNGSAGY